MIEIGPADRKHAHQHAAPWNPLVVALVQYAFSERPAGIIEVRRRPWDGPQLLATIGLTPEHRLDGGRLNVSWVERCSPALLEAIAIDWVFELGQCWITSGDLDHLDQLDEVGAQVSEFERSVTAPTTSVEVIASTGDASAVLWLHPRPPLSQVVTDVAFLAQSAGWPTEADPSAG